MGGGGKGGGGEQTVGYRYYMGLHMGVCHGPIDSLIRIIIGDREAWAGNQTTSGSITIDKPELFGGDQREGGIQGQLDVMMGEDAQVANDYLTTVQSGDQPAYRGILSAVFRRGLVSAVNPYIKPWAWKVCRILAGWEGGATAWYSDKAVITLDSGDKAANPAHIVYECLTNTLWGMGYSSSLIDDAAFRTAADTFYTEGLGLCLAWSQQDKIENFLQVVMDHAGAVVGQDRRTGLFVLRAIRAIADPSSLPLLDPTNVVSVESFERPSIAETINEVTVKYVDVETGKDSLVTVQNIANVQAQGGVVSQTKSYDGLPTYDLAARVAERDLRVASTPLARYKLRTNRSTYALLPGDAFRFAWPRYGIGNVVLRVLRINYGDLTNGQIEIDAAEDVFGLPSSSYTSQQPTIWEPPNTTPVAPTYYDILEASYYDMVLAMGQATAENVDSLAAYVGAVASHPGGLNIRYDLYTKVGTAEYSRAGPGDWCPTGTLSSPMTVTETSFAITGASAEQMVTSGRAILIGNEVMRLETFDSGTLTGTVARGCADTVPAAHSAGERVWFYQPWQAEDFREYVSGETISGKFCSVTTSTILPLDDAPTDTVTVAGRQGKPYPPGKLRINGNAYPATVAATTFTVTWAHRDRKLQADQLVPEGDTSIGPEAGTTYAIRFYDGSSGALLKSDTTSGTSYSYSPDATILLLHGEGSDGSTTITDEAGHTVTPSGDARIRTAQFKFGSASIYFDGSGDYLVITPATDFAFGTGDFTAEMFIRPAVVDNYKMIFDFRPDSAGGAYPVLYTTPTGALAYDFNGATRITGGSLSADAWVHVAVCRAAGVTRMFLDGTQIGGNYTDAGDYLAGVIRIGRNAYNTSAYDFSGYMDEVRILKGMGVYTANFTPPAAPLSMGAMPGSIRVDVEAVRDGLTSHQKASHTWGTA